MASTTPLLMLKVYVEVCRQGSMKRAAESLYVTTGAVNHHVKSLEETLGTKLLVRKKGGLELTPVGGYLFEQLAAAFDQIEHSVAVLRKSIRTQGTSEPLTITTTNSFASGWLIPRIGSFLKENPRIDFRVESSSDIVNLANEMRIDLAIRHGLGYYEGLYSRMLLDPHMLPVMSPTLLNGRTVSTPGELLSYPLLHDIDRADWRLWLQAHKIQADVSNRGAAFADSSVLVQAAVAGHGIALIEDIHAEAELKSGRLIVPIDRPVSRAFAYYLVARPASLRRGAVRKFVEWVGLQLDREDRFHGEDRMIGGHQRHRQEAEPDPEFA